MSVILFTVVAYGACFLAGVVFCWFTMRALIEQIVRQDVEERVRKQIHDAEWAAHMSRETAGTAVIHLRRQEVS